MSCPDEIPIHERDPNWWKKPKRQREEDEKAKTPRDPNVNEEMTRDQAYDIAIAFGKATGIALQPKPRGVGWSAEVPLEHLRDWMPERNS